MQPHQQRVINEKSDLDQKIRKLNGFLMSDTFRELGRTEKDLLLWQLSIMQEYSEILKRRISVFVSE